MVKKPHMTYTHSILWNDESDPMRCVGWSFKMRSVSLFGYIALLSLELVEPFTNFQRHSPRGWDQLHASAVETATATAINAVAAVSKVVSMKTLSAPDLKQSFIALDVDASVRGEVDASGLPLVYNKDLIEKYWAKEQGALQSRWGEFIRYSVPFLSRVAALLVRGGKTDGALS